MESSWVFIPIVMGNLIRREGCLRKVLYGMLRMAGRVRGSYACKQRDELRGCFVHGLEGVNKKKEGAKNAKSSYIGC